MQRGSLISKILGLMLTLILLSSSLSIFSLTNLYYSLDDAKAINASGSLRMQSYRLLLAAQTDNKLNVADGKIQRFEQTLYSPELKQSLDWSSSQRLKAQYLLVIDKWGPMKQLLQQGKLADYAASLPEFVGTINLFVKETEQHAEFKLRLLAVIQAVGLALMFVLALVAVRYTRRKVVEPLNQLMLSANTIAKGNFEVDMPQSEYIELQALADALDSTAKELSALYQHLESQVAEKTLALTRAHQELSFLYDNVVKLHGSRLDFQVLQGALNQLKAFERLEYLRLIISYEADSEEIIEADGGWPVATPPSCRFALTFEGTDLGYLEVISCKQPNAALFENFAIVLARSILIHQATEQQQQLALMEERGVIARELHDSLGQVLSFLKIQISLLRRSLAQSGQSEAVTEQLNEINDGVNTAYVQLRELLSTFRLSIKDPNLKHALEAMLEQLRGQTESQIVLDYQISEQLFGASQHIHLLQLTREAVLNAIKHAKASEIRVQLYKHTQGMISISISDNGIGISHLKERDQHFGIGIMHERASKLDGQLQFLGNPAGGTTIMLTIPQHQEALHG